MEDSSVSFSFQHRTYAYNQEANRFEKIQAPVSGTACSTCFAPLRSISPASLLAAFRRVCLQLVCVVCACVGRGTISDPRPVAGEPSVGGVRRQPRADQAGRRRWVSPGAAMACPRCHSNGSMLIQLGRGLQTWPGRSTLATT